MSSTKDSTAGTDSYPSSNVRGGGRGRGRGAGLESNRGGFSGRGGRGGRGGNSGSGGSVQAAAAAHRGGGRGGRAAGANHHRGGRGGSHAAVDSGHGGTGAGQMRGSNHHHHRGRGAARGRGMHGGAHSSGSSAHQGSDHTYTHHDVNHPFIVEDELRRFWLLVEQRVLGHREGSTPPVDTNQPTQLRLWIRCWDAAASEAHGPFACLPRALLLLPGSANCLPPVDTVLRVLCRVAQTPNAHLDDLECTARVVHDRLMPSIGSGSSLSLRASSLGVQALVPHVVCLMGALGATLPRFIAAKPNQVGRVLALFAHVEQYRARLAEVASSAFSSSAGIAGWDEVDDAVALSSALAGVSVGDSWLQWRSAPTVGWLMSPAWHDAPQLGNTYASTAEYAQCLLRMWTLLTFYWASAAVWPKCNHRRAGAPGAAAEASDANNVCGTPLFANTTSATASSSSSSSSMGSCRSIIRGSGRCPNPAAFRCQRGHDHDAICARCLRRQQDALADAPGPHASTDVYDAVIDRETVRRDGTVLVVSQLNSRRPPQIAPNWRTSYRLPVSGLVAVVRLDASGQPLVRTAPLLWAEIVAVHTVAGFDDDWKAREQGRMALRMLTRGDVPGLAIADVDGQTGPLEPSVRLAIIDARVFVPEVLSVLGTFAQDSFRVHLDQIPFMPTLIGAASELASASTSSSAHVSGAAVSSSSATLLASSYSPAVSQALATQAAQAAVRQAIEHSEMDLLRRLAVKRRAELIDSICALEPVRLLYGTQLDAFCAALRFAAHATQGPPGTGKSFVGVAIALALLLIRKACLDSGFAVGPIVTLSYKNHAEDEFLCDVLRFAERSKIPLAQDSLIRCGKPERPELLRFSERHTPAEKRAEDELMRCVAVVRQAQRTAREWTSLADALARGERMSMRAGSAAPSPVIASHEADALATAIVLCARISASATASATSAAASSATNASVSSASASIQSSVRELQRMPPSDAFGLIAFSQGCLTVHSASASQDVAQLMYERFLQPAEHWRLGPYDEHARMTHFVMCLAAWLNGQHPPPRCTARAEPNSDTQCLQITDRPGSLCSARHRCLFAAEHEWTLECSAARVSDTIVFCESHRCAAATAGRNGCVNSRCHDSVGSAFCASHTCPGCLIAGSQPVLQRQGQFACAKHQCRGSGDATRAPCSRLALLPFGFCNEHLCRTCAVNPAPSASNLPLVRPGAKHCADHTCAFIGCNAELRQPGSRLCAAHCCVICLEEEKAECPIDDTCMNSHLCEMHRCAHPELDCEYVRQAGSTFCALHTCATCAASGVLVDSPVTTDPPRKIFACAQHKMCSHMFASGNHCCLPALPDVFYCERHFDAALIADAAVAAGADRVTAAKGDGHCFGVIKNGKRRCRARGEHQNGAPWYCKDHLDQQQGSGPAIVDDSADLAAEARRNLDLVLELEQAAIVCPRPVHVDQLRLVHAANGARAVPDTVSYLQCSGIDAPDKQQCLARTLANGMRKWECPLHAKVHAVSGKQKPAVEVENTAAPTAASPMPVSHSARDQISAHSLPVANAVSVGTKPPVAVSCADTDADDGVDDEDDDEFVEIEFVDAALADDAVAGDVHPDELDVVDDHQGNADSDGKEEAKASEIDDVPEVNENLQHLRDIMGEDEMVDNEIESDDDEDEDGASAGSAASASSSSTSASSLKSVRSSRTHVAITHRGRDRGRVRGSSGPGAEQSAATSAREFGWEPAPADRWRLASRFLLDMQNALRLLAESAEGRVAEARRNRAEAAAQSFREAKIIGATVVGAVRRLEAIRAAEPFAVVVEEACEVMEPTLVAVLAVGSLRKLELIGDHRQLPAFVQNCWFNLEGTHPSIKTSLFERLICPPAQSAASTGGRSVRSHRDRGADPSDGQAALVPYTILDEQRRMCAAIADLTRHDYADVVSISDHPHTATQRVGDRLPDSAVVLRRHLAMHRQLWAGAQTQLGIQAVPGLQTSIFFWDVAGNREGRPVAGLSACNYVEAAHVTALAQYFLLCGVPPSSISIITPYKGQKTLIIKNLRAAKCLTGFKHGAPPSRFEIESSITVSTVDRYQGDENDIIILSLVRTQPGNRFIGLLNRFIVAVSRARLGLYVIGSLAGVTGDKQGRQGPAHWMRFADQLRQPEPNTTAIAAESARSASAATDVAAQRSQTEPATAISRIGSSLPVCCPRHGLSSAATVNAPEKFPTSATWTKFCALPCAHVLTCGHVCRVPCHSPTLTPHTEKCQELVPRPCVAHADVPLVCADVFGKSSVPNRTSPASLDSALREFKCTIPVSFPRPQCQHMMQLPCDQHRAMVVDKTAALPSCTIVVGDFVHPRCGHVIKKPTCAQRRKFEESPPECHVKVTYRRPCGCEMEMQCHLAAAEELRPTPCLREVLRVRPRCGHPYSLRCHEASAIQSGWDAQGGISAVSGDHVLPIVQQCVKYGPGEQTWRPKLMDCGVPIDFRASCGHVLSGKLPCHIAFECAFGTKETPRCSCPVEIDSPLCTHRIKVPCHFAQAVRSWQVWDASTMPAVGALGNVIVMAHALTDVPQPAISHAAIAALRRSCQENVSVRLSCTGSDGTSHWQTISCSRLLDIALGRDKLARCEILVKRELTCAHTIDVPCHARAELPQPLCRAVVNESVLLSCGVHSLLAGTCGQLSLLRAAPPPCMTLVTAPRYRCGHAATVPCYLADSVTAVSVPGSRIELESDPDHDGKEESKGTESSRYVVVEADGVYCAAEAGGVPACQELVKFRFAPCGHLMEKVPCAKAFAWTQGDQALRCPQPLDIHSPICGHDLRVSCAVAQRVATWQPWPIVEVADDTDANSEPVHYAPTIVTLAIDENGDPVRGIRVRFDDPKPLLLPVGVDSSDLHCNASVMYLRPCGHEARVNCSDAFSRNVGHCQALIPEVCEMCAHQSTVTCHQRRSGEIMPCLQDVVRPCSKCHITPMNGKCNVLIRECKHIVTATLPCHHEVKWRCGTDADPRALDEFPCRVCTLAEWKTALSVCQAGAEQLAALETGLKRRLRYLLQSCNIVQHVELPLAKVLGNYVTARAAILESYLKLARQDRNSRQELLPAPAPLGSDVDIESCRLVFTVVGPRKSKNPVPETDAEMANRVLQSFTCAPPMTPVGAGTLVSCIESAASFDRLTPAADTGLVTVCVGAAFALKTKLGAQVFLPPKGQLSNDQKKLEANKFAHQLQSNGFDSAQIPGASTDVVFWRPGSVLPLEILRLRLHVNCSICMEAISISKGFFCSNCHFLCWGCFGGYVEDARKPGAIGRSVDPDGNLVCPCCKDVYDLHAVATAGGPPEVFKLLMELKFSVQEQRAVSDAVRVHTKKLQEEFERVQRLEGDTRTAHQLRLDVIENVLTLKCPRPACRMAFLDFTGCFALTCSQRTCNAAFCAWCLADCGRDAHAHVATCRENRSGGLYGKSQEFDDHHRRRKREIIVQRLQVTNANVRTIFLEIMQKEFEDLGIVI